MRLPCCQLLNFRLTTVIFPSDNCQTKKIQLSDDYLYMN